MRLSDWEQRLADYLASKQTAAFVWGENDCLLFSGGAVEAVTGANPWAHLAGRYSTKREAARVLRELGAGTLVNLVTQTLGERVPSAFLQRGDLVLYRNAIGVCVGKDALFVGQEGEREGLLREARAVWAGGWRI